MKIDNFERGELVDSRFMSYEEMVVIFGKPLADRLQQEKTEGLATLTVKSVDTKNKTITFE